MCLILVIALCALLFCSCAVYTQSKNDFLRLHIRANSNSDADQAVKLKARDAVVEYLSPLLTTVSTESEAAVLVKSHLGVLKSLCENILDNNGFSYGAEAVVKREKFPTKNYGNLVLEGGVYEAVVINLGSGEGDNWWCVAFPPLCFVGEESDGNVKYKSILMEIIEKWRKNEKESN